jgi:tRNA-specific 2-thiouridylase
MRVLVAMSGGVDSSIAAARLVRAGHDVVGATLKLWGGESDTGCCSVSDVDDARRVAQQLGIDHHVFNFGDEFHDHVVAPYVRAHAEGDTPNPCIECNRHVKFERFVQRAEVLGFDAVATGHHARVVTDASGRRRLARGADRAKDQSYVLYMLAADRLAGIELPVGDTTKDDVRAEAARLGLRTAGKADSQDVCFITNRRGRGAFLAERIELHAGTIVDEHGREVGAVDAVELVTVGQRRGLAVAVGSPRFVTAIDRERRVVQVGPADHLLDEGLGVEDVVWWDGRPPIEPVRCRVQCAAHGLAHPAVLHPSRSGARVEWVQPQRRVAAGQSAVFYDDTAVAGHDVVLGGGIVRSREARAARLR